MTDALGQALTWFYTQHPGEALIAVTQFGNSRARRAIERVGGQIEGDFVQYGAPQVRYRIPVPGTK